MKFESKKEKSSVLIDKWLDLGLTPAEAMIQHLKSCIIMDLDNLKDDSKRFDYDNFHSIGLIDLLLHCIETPGIEFTMEILDETKTS